MFGEIVKHPDRDQRYADAMTYISNGPGLEHHHIVNGYDWASLGKGTVVDVGGSHGSLSIAIAQAFPLLRCIVQDRPEVIALGPGKLPSNVHGRINFMAHDFFQEQPVKDANIYILRWILHDWSDTYATRIIQRLIPALRLGAKLLVLEQVLPGPGEISKYLEKAYRLADAPSVHSGLKMANSWVQVTGFSHVGSAQCEGTRLEGLEGAIESRGPRLRAHIRDETSGFETEYSGDWLGLRQTTKCSTRDIVRLSLFAWMKTKSKFLDHSCNNRLILLFLFICYLAF